MGKKKNRNKAAAQAHPEPITEEQDVATDELEATEPEPETAETADDADCAEVGGANSVPYVDFCKRMATYGLAVPEISNRSTAAEAKRWARVFVEALAMSLANGQSVRVPDLGTFSVVVRKERNGVNPRTGEKMVIAARKAVHFSPTKALKDAIHG